MSTISQSLFDSPPQSAQPVRTTHPLRLLAILSIQIFLAEMVAMVVLYFTRIPDYLGATLLDGVIMMALIAPALYFLHLRPLINQIEERNRAEEALRTSEQLLWNVLELLPVGVWITDKYGKIVHGNPASQSIWAGTRYVGIDQYGEYKGWWSDTGEPIAPEEWPVVRAITRGESSLNEEIEIEAFDGTHKIILNSVVPILNEQNAVQGAIIVNQDVTQRRKAARELLHTNELLERFFASIDTLIAYMDRDFNFIRVNDAYAKEGGHPPEFFIGKNHFDLYPHEENLAIFRRVVETGKPFSVFEKAFEYPDDPARGVTYWDWGLQPVREPYGVVEGVVLSLVNVTERRRSREQLARQNEELRALTEAEHRQRELAEGLARAVMAVNSSLEIDQVLGAILEQIRKAIPFQGAAILLIEGQCVRAASWLGFERYPGGTWDRERLYALENYPLIQKACTTLQPVQIEGASEYPGWRVDPDMSWVYSYLAVPLIIGEEAIGVIDLYSDSPAAYPQAAVAQLLAFATPAALALQNAQLYRAESIARRFAETMSTAALALSKTLDLEQVINTLLEHLNTIVPADIASVTMLKDETHLAVRTLRGYGGWAYREDIPHLPIDGITDALLQRLKLTRKSLVIPNLFLGSDLERHPGGEHVRNWLVVPILAGDQLIGLVELGQAGSEEFNPEHARWAEALAGQAAVAIQNAWLFDQVRASSERLQSLAQKLVKVHENERYHIARELHDEAGQALSSLKISLGRLVHDPDCPENMRLRLLELRDVAEGVLEELRRLAIDLRPVALDHLGLVQALEQAAKKLDSEQLTVRFKALGFEGLRLSREVETSLYRIVQEALTNIARHAQASNVGILLEWRDDKVKVFVEDDGTGFAPEKVESKDHLGLVGMRERAEMLGGSLTIESTPGMGTTVVVEVQDVDTDPDRG